MERQGRSMNNNPSILIVGAGAIGSFYGAILKKAGCSVSTVLRSGYDAVRAQGIRITSPLGDLSYEPDHVYRDGDLPEETPDFLILCVKVLPGVDRVALVAPWMGEKTRLVLIENGLARHRVPGSFFSADAVCLSPTKPKSIELVQVPNIAHPVPNAIAITDFVHRILIGSNDILPRDHRTSDHQLASLTALQLVDLIQRFQWSIIDFDHLPLDIIEPRSHANAFSLG